MMEIEEIVKVAQHYFGKNRTALKKKLLTYEFSGKVTRKWKRNIKQVTSHPFRLYFKLFDEVIDGIIDNDISEIDWHWIGDVSWEIEVVLNPDIKSGLDWDKRLATKCGGTAHILRIQFSDLIPCYTIDTYTMSYDKKQNYYGFTPLKKLLNDEKKIVNAFKKLFRNEGYTFLNKREALKKYDGLYSDLKNNATLFDVLFTDISHYETDYVKFSDKPSMDQFGVSFRWKEYYKSTGTLIKREEDRHYPSGNHQRTILDEKGRITDVIVRRNFGNKKFQEVAVDVVSEYRKRKKSNDRDK